MINKIMNLNSFVCEFKQHLFTRTLPGDCCLTTKAISPLLNSKNLTE